MILGSGNILKSLLVGKSFGLDEKFLHISEEDFVVFILFRVVGRLTNHYAEERGPVLLKIRLYLSRLFSSTPGS